MVPLIRWIVGEKADEVVAGLVAEFGSAHAVLSASDERLRRAVADHPDVAIAIGAARSLLSHVLRGKLDHQPVIKVWADLLDYLRLEMAALLIEQVRVVHLNSGNVIIRDETAAEGTTYEAKVYVREIVRRALEVGSSAIMLVHNHPAGETTPSWADIDLTRRVAEAGKSLGLTVFDHIIVTSNECISMRELGLI